MTIHQNQPVLEMGADIQNARRVLILLHGRGATAESMLPIAKSLELPGSRVLIPQAAGNRWYPQTAFGPLEVNEPDLSSALDLIDGLLSATRDQGISNKSIFLGGFSQGACLAAEYVARHYPRLGGLFVFSGALIGPPDQPRPVEGDLEGMPVFIGGSDQDPWISHEWMSTTADFFNEANAVVDIHTYPGMSHTVTQAEIKRVISILTNVK